MAVRHIGLLFAVMSLAFAACAGDGDSPEPVVPASTAESPAPYFVDIAAEAGLDVVQIAGDPNADYIIDSLGAGAAWLDYDNDGDADLYLVQGATKAERDGPPDRLLRNDGATGGMPQFGS